MDLALIGNCAFQALIDSKASVRWLCWPRFDSSFVFGGLLDPDKGGDLSVLPEGEGWTTRQFYLPNTNILRTVFSSEESEFEVTDFAPRFRQYERFFKPRMLVRRLRPIRGTPVVAVTCRPVCDYGRHAPSPYQASNHLQWPIPGGPLRLTTNAPLTFVETRRPFALQRDTWLALTWGAPLEAPLYETCSNFYHRTRSYWETWVKHLRLPGVFEDEVIRSALALKLHQYEDTGAITAATTTSLPEFPGAGRNWDYRYCWLRDAFFTLSALLRMGHFEEIERFVDYLRNIAETTQHELQPVYGIAGEAELTEMELSHLSGWEGNQPVRVGNAAYAQCQFDVYGEMILAISPLYLDPRFQTHEGRRTTELIHRLLGRIETTLEAPDAGVWEKRDLPHVHTFTLLLHWAGARQAQRIGRRLGDDALAQKATDLRTRADHLIEKAWRGKPGFYSDAIDTNFADAALFQMVNLGYLREDNPRSHTHVDALAYQLANSHEHLIHRYRHHDGLGDTHAAFTVCSFWYAEALAHIGEKKRAEQIVKKLMSHANHVGLLSEDIDPDSGKMLGNFPQTYSHVGLINAAFAIKPQSATLATLS